MAGAIQRKEGFTLLEMSIVLVIIAIVVGGGMTIFGASVQKRQLQETQAKIKAIQKALYDFRVAFNRLPCPADVTQPLLNSYFGAEASYIPSMAMYMPTYTAIPKEGFCIASPAELYGIVQDIETNFSQTLTETCTSTANSNIISGCSTASLISGMAIAGDDSIIATESADSPFPFGANVLSITDGTHFTVSQPAGLSGSFSLTFIYNVEGMVPVATLNLPDDYAIDGWGRRIMYAVDPALTAQNAFYNVPVTDTTTRMTVKDASANIKTNKAAYVLISFGPNGHGGYPRGSSSPISTGSMNTDEQSNCNCDNNANPTAPSGIFVQKTATQDPTHPNHAYDFDDIVVFATRSALASPRE